MDFVLASLIFSIVFAGIMLSLQNVRDTFGTEERSWRIQSAALPAADVLVRSEGAPINWHMNPASVKIPGLAGIGNSLSPAKLGAFDDLDYDFTREMLGLDGFDYQLLLMQNDDVILSKGSVSGSDIVVAITRKAMYNGNAATIQLKVWEEEDE